MNNILDQEKTKKRRAKIIEVLAKSPQEIEEFVLPTVADIYSHAAFNRRTNKSQFQRFSK